MKCYVSGSSGLIGTALRSHLVATGHEVIRLPRSTQGADLATADAVIHLAGENIAEGRWTVDKKQRIAESRVEGTRRLAHAFASTAPRSSVFISASATGYYGSRGDEPLDEGSPAGRGFLADVCQGWEHAAQEAGRSGHRTLLLRTGMVLSPAGGALKKMIVPFKAGLGARLGTGRQYLSWISLQDVVMAIGFLLANGRIRGPVNLVAPCPVTNREFTAALARVLKRPAIMAAPAFALRMLFGEMADELLLSSARVLPKKLLAAGYPFRNLSLQFTLEELLS